MNCRLTEHRIRSTCRELLACNGRVSGRALRRELRARYGAVGKAARVFEIWREESAAIQATPVSPDVAEMAARLITAEKAAVENKARAELAELREQAHQQKWAMEIDRLRVELHRQPKYAAEIRQLQDQVFRLTADLHATRLMLSRREQGRDPAPEA